jgi:hypothetical protein
MRNALRRDILFFLVSAGWNDVVDPKTDGERLGANDDLKHLAQQRAGRVKEYLLQVGKVDGERIFLSEESEAKVTDKGCRAYLHLR